MKNNENENEKEKEKTCQKFICKLCNYSTNRNSQFLRHLGTLKHKKNENNEHIEKTNYKDKIINNINECKIQSYKCECGKYFTKKNNLTRHKNLCNYIDDKEKWYMKNDIDKEKDKESNSLIIKLVEENVELKNMMYKQFESMQKQMMYQQKLMQDEINELIPKIGNNNTVNKQKFNINIFLNEYCKDAITMDEFINKIQITVEDLSITKNKGFSEGVSNIFLENMKKLSLYERPIHCTDSKREIIYIKYNDENKELKNKGFWCKDEEKEKLKEALNKVSNIQRKNLDKWEKDHPNWENNIELQNEYIKLVKNCTEDLRENNNENKIIRKLCNEININNED